MNLVIAALIAVATVSYVPCASAENTEPLIANYSQVMSLPAPLRAQYMYNLAKAFQEFDIAVNKTSKDFALNLPDRGPGFWETFQLFPTADAQEGPTPVGVPETSIGLEKDDFAYNLACRDGYVISTEAGSCVLSNSRVSWSSDLSGKNFPELKKSHPCPDKHSRVGVSSWGWSSDSWCMSDAALKVMNPQRAAKLREGNAGDAGVTETGNSRSAAINMLRTTFGSANGEANQRKLVGKLRNEATEFYAAENANKAAVASHEKKLIKDLQTGEERLAADVKSADDKAATDAFNKQMAENLKNSPTVVANLQAGTNRCSAYQCDPTKFKKDAKAAQKWRNEWQKKGLGKDGNPPCTIGGMPSSYKDGKVVPGNCQKINSLKRLNMAEVKCDNPDETMCNPAFYCKPPQKTRELSAQDVLLCQNPNGVKGQIQASCRAKHIKAWQGREEVNTNCLDNSPIQGIRELYKDTVDEYNRLCFGDDKTFREYFCSECEMLSERIQSANTEAFKTRCAVAAVAPEKGGSQKSNTTR